MSPLRRPGQVAELDVLATYRPRALVIASFVALTAGFFAGYWMGREGRPGKVAAPPHAVGAQEFIQLGMRALGAGEFATAEGHFRQAARLRPDDPAPHADLAVALMYQQRWPEAAAEIDLAKRYGREAPEVYFLEGLLARDGLADTARARTAWERFLGLVPSEAPQAAMVRAWVAELDSAPGPGSAGVEEALDEATAAESPEAFPPTAPASAAD